jgi:hypothetical protein
MTDGIGVAAPALHTKHSLSNSNSTFSNVRMQAQSA